MTWFRRRRPRTEPGAGVQAMEPEAYAELCAPYQRRLYQVALGMAGDPDQAADLAQEALVRGFRSLHGFKPGAPLYPWLLRIMRNIWIDELKSARGRREVPMERSMETAGHAADPLASVLESERSVALHRAIASLPPEFAMTITLFDLQGMSYEEVARATGVPVGTVRSRLHRARDRLRVLLG